MRPSHVLQTFGVGNQRPGRASQLGQAAHQRARQGGPVSLARRIGELVDLAAVEGVSGLGRWYTFVKMDAHTLIDMAQAYTLAHPAGKDKPVDLRLITDFATALKATGGLEKRGEIIAVDLFNSYEDRFFPGG